VVDAGTVGGFATTHLSRDVDVVAPDGSEVRILLRRPGAGLAHFRLAPGHTSVAVHHRTVDEIWYFLSGRGQMWRRDGAHEETVEVGPGVCVTIPAGTRFQFRSVDAEALTAVGVTIPPWPGDGEAIRASGPWTPTVAPGPGLAEPGPHTSAAR
jgi:mannose-6-phosphate isomerase-like protein (cupin superfamily)